MEILSKEIAGEIVMEAIYDAMDAIGGMGQGFVVTGTCDDDVVLRESRNVGSLIDGFFEFCQTLSVLGADGFFLPSAVSLSALS